MVICETERILTDTSVLPVPFTLIIFLRVFRLGPLINHGPDLGFYSTPVFSLSFLEFTMSRLGLPGGVSVTLKDSMRDLIRCHKSTTSYSIELKGF